MKDWEREVREVAEKESKRTPSTTEKHPYLYFFKKLADGLDRYPQLRAEVTWRQAMNRLNRYELLDAPTIPNTDKVIIVSNEGDGDVGSSLRAISKTPAYEHIKPKAAIINMLWNPKQAVEDALGGRQMAKEMMWTAFDAARAMAENLGTLMDKEAIIHFRIHPLVWYKVRRMFEEAEWDVDHWPFIWYLPNRSGGYRGPRDPRSRQFWRGNDIVPWMYIRRGSGKVLPRPNIVTHKILSSERCFHDNDLPPYVVQEILAIHPEPGWVIDPACDGGSALRHSYRCGWNVLGIASNEREANAARHRITRHPVRPIPPRTGKEYYE